jgi:hypothetical protein
MYYIIQDNLFREEGHTKLINTLKKFNLEYELVETKPFIEDIEFKTKLKDNVFVFGSLKLARLSKNYGWYPGALITENHNYEVYSKYYKENLLNYDSRIFKFGDDFEWIYDQHFIRPCLDSKVWTGKVFEKCDWDLLKERTFANNKLNREEFGDDYPILLDENTLIQVATPKKITQEVRCWVVDGKIVTQSTYRRGSFIVYDNVVDQDAIDFAQSMVNIFELDRAFVIDVCLTANGWKIVECGSISCAGYYDSDVQKIIMALEDVWPTKNNNSVIDY